MHFDGTLILLYFIEMLPRTVSLAIFNWHKKIHVKVYQILCQLGWGFEETKSLTELL